MLKDEFQLAENIGYEVENNANEQNMFNVKGLTNKSKVHQVIVDENNQNLKCDCLFFQSFQLFCRHILKVFQACNCLNMNVFLQNIYTRWIKRNNEEPSHLPEVNIEIYYYTCNIK